MKTPSRSRPLKPNTQASRAPRSHTDLVRADQARCLRRLLKSGIYTEPWNSRFAFNASLETLTAEYTREFLPQSIQERDFVEILAHITWYLLRLDLQQATLYHSNLHGDPYDRPLESYLENERILDRIGRDAAILQRSFREALAGLRRLQAEGPLRSQT